MGGPNNGAWKRRIDMSGQRFGRLVALRDVGALNGSRAWQCQCDCGAMVTVRGTHLRRGASTSCGCWQREVVTKRSTTHGLFRSPTHVTWIGMIDRCTNPRCKDFCRYGARGITVCERWKKFVNFLDDMGVKPEGMTLERVNNELGYCKENCRWATVVEQQSNKRTNHFLEFSGERMTMTQWAKRLGMKKVTLQTRLRNGWSVERALSEPVGRNRNA